MQEQLLSRRRTRVHLTLASYTQYTHLQLVVREIEAMRSASLPTATPLATYLPTVCPAVSHKTQRSQLELLLPRKFL